MRSVIHLTSVHPRYDVRIFLKMCRSLTSEFRVSLVVADGLGDSERDAVHIYDVGPQSGIRWIRMTSTVRRVFDMASEMDGDLYHLHDPELIPIGLKLRKLGKRVIFDAHEDLPNQLKSKPYLGSFRRRALALGASAYENWALPRFDTVIGATPAITKRLSAINSSCENINNYPILDELSGEDKYAPRSREVSYVGGMSRIRGISYLVDAMDYTVDVKLNLIGTFGDELLENEVKAKNAFRRVNYLGFMQRDEVRAILARSSAGVVTFLATPNHVDAQPNKMFEYMSAGVPVITSDFPLWRQIVEGSGCGICVDPTDPAAIGEAIQSLVDNPTHAREMGSRGRHAVAKKYNWANEEAKLLALYRRILE